MRFAENTTMSDYTSSMTNFSFSLFREMSIEDDGNLFASTFSMRLILMLLAIGSNGKTSNQLKSILNLPKNRTFGYKEYKPVIKMTEDPSILTIANGVFVDQTFDLSIDYVYRARKYLNSEVRSLNFHGNPSAGETEINEWTRNKTNGKISNLFNPGDIGRDTKLILTSAVYFENAWKTPFYESKTANFSVSTMNFVEVEMLHTIDFLKYYKNDEYKFAAVEIPYQDGDYAMVVVLPDRIDGLKALEKRFLGDSKVFSALVSNMTVSTVFMDLPKFKYGSEFSFKGTLENLGCRDMFTRDSDFSEMSPSESCSQLKVDDIKHKTYVEVDEEGTTAAAVVGGSIMLYMLDDFPHHTKTVFFNAHHPFLFIIKKRADIVFMGRMVNPNA